MISPAASVTSLVPLITPEPIEPPIERFMNCAYGIHLSSEADIDEGEAGDIRLSEIGILLRDYRRLGLIVTTLNARQTPS